MNTLTSFTNQKKMILNHLRLNESITAIEALDYYQCMRLAARIADLRREGYKIKSTTIHTGSRKRITKYSLVNWCHPFNTIDPGTKKPGKPNGLIQNIIIKPGENYPRQSGSVNRFVDRAKKMVRSNPPGSWITSDPRTYIQNYFSTRIICNRFAPGVTTRSPPGKSNSKRAGNMNCLYQMIIIPGDRGHPFTRGGLTNF